LEYIDLEKWPRREHFEFFHRMDYPQTNVCMNIDVTHFLDFVKKNRLSFYYSMIFASTLVCNRIPEFRCRIRKDGVVLHEMTHPSFTDLSKGSELFKYVTVDMKDDLFEFCRCAKEASEKQTEHFPESAENRDDVIYITCLPWISFTSVCHTVSLNRDDSVPRLSWGKYFEQNGKILMPYSVQVNHALLDGLQISKFVQDLQNYIDQL
jgi:chloramphenicol O-acetyltransferase type A